MKLLFIESLFWTAWHVMLMLPLDGEGVLFLLLVLHEGRLEFHHKRNYSFITVSDNSHRPFWTVLKMGSSSHLLQKLVQHHLEEVALKMFKAFTVTKSCSSCSGEKFLPSSRSRTFFFRGFSKYWITAFFSVESFRSSSKVKLIDSTETYWDPTSKL